MTENKGHDPGWNDPPLFTYDRATEIQANAAKKGSHLNKRVAFPLSGVKTTSVGVDPTVAQVPVDFSKIAAPPTSSVPPAPPKLTPPPPAEEETTVVTGNLADQLKAVLDNLRIVHDVNENDEISKRLRIMENMWLDGKLDQHVRKKLQDLSLALKNGDYESADHIQKSLMVDHVAVCSTWMGGVRQLINQKRDN